LKSRKNDDLSLTNEGFDIDHVDLSCVFSTAKDYYCLQTLIEFERESIIAERMELICNQHLMSKALKLAAKVLPTVIPDSKVGNTDVTKS